MFSPSSFITPSSKTTQSPQATVSSVGLSSNLSSFEKGSIDSNFYFSAVSQIFDEPIDPRFVTRFEGCIKKLNFDNIQMDSIKK
jgi:hypothetical protein